MDNYILEGKTPVKCIDMFKWAKANTMENRRVAETEKDGVRVSTVFLGIDHSYDGKEPVLFETMIFGGDHDDNMWRYTTWEGAVIGHDHACKLAGV